MDDAEDGVVKQVPPVLLGDFRAQRLVHHLRDLPHESEGLEVEHLFHLERDDLADGVHVVRAIHGVRTVLLDAPPQRHGIPRAPRQSLPPVLARPPVMPLVERLLFLVEEAFQMKGNLLKERKGCRTHILIPSAAKPHSAVAECIVSISVRVIRRRRRRQWCQSRGCASTVLGVIIGL